MMLTVLLLAFGLLAQAQSLPGTAPLTIQGNPAELMIEGLDRFVTRELAASIERRPSFWKPDYSSRKAYESSVAQNRQRFRKIIGAVDQRVAFESPALDATVSRPAQVASGAG